jgi:hypothetical protein
MHQTEEQIISTKAGIRAHTQHIAVASNKSILTDNA